MLLVFALTIGGGGSPAPLPELALELATAIAFILWLLPTLKPDVSARMPRIGWLATLVMALTAALPAVQLIPLPAAIWTKFNGRESEIAALSLVGAAGKWASWSVAPSVTLSALLSLGPPLLLLSITASSPPKAANTLFWIIVTVELGAAFLGALQLASGGTAFYLYPATQLGWITGFHANRNAAADAFLIAILACSALVSLEQPAEADGWRYQSAMRFKRIRIGLALADAVFVLATVLTGSRTGIALLVPVMLIQAAIVLPAFGGLTRSRVVGLLGALSTLGLIALAMANFNSATSKVLSRFLSVGSDARPQLWIDTRFAITQYWPFGSGIGTFVQAMLPAERLEVVQNAVPNRAHNDYLELALEGGVFGLTLAALTALLLSWGFLRTWRAGYRPRALAAGGALVVIGLHSLVDYPLRNMAISCLAGIAAGLLCAPIAPVQHGAGGRKMDEAL